MNTYIKTILLFTFLVLTSCEDVIEIELQSVPPKLVIEASLDWEKNTLGNEQMIRLSTSTPYFDTATNTFVTGASVKVINNSNNTEFIFEDQNNGDYLTSDFVPIINQSYTLEIIYNGEYYSATETLIPVVDISGITQSRNRGFDEEVLEVNVNFNDPVEKGNYYLFRYWEDGDLLVRLDGLKDEFTNGNPFSWYFEKIEDEDNGVEEFVSGDLVFIDFFGISKGYYNYINVLTQQTGGVSLFGTIPVPLKGNCINLDNPDNDAYGYFRLTQVIRSAYTFQ
ncbi:DUF4249 domain-containing protein [Flavivirga jejuensis]|uniref:DUF4249 domain-containing protein n=1 Tax=Flavivirga jejuensis TaxID=870487 RepID=A0ABT8WIY8_9FLAO|nr:DUF4249 domain-containing protein [Flavivirga jejuensis]MDO5973127.1 DUF4249 domain-containing protein [Flavivirga jejuensis]